MSEVTFHFPADQPMPKGLYFVIDPCYVFGQLHHSDPELWDKICHFIYRHPNGDHRRDPQIPVQMVFNDHVIWIWGTARGDGNYPVFQNDKEIGHAGVDAGLLCFCPEKLVRELEEAGNDCESGLGVVVNIKEDGPPVAFTNENEDRVGNARWGTCTVITE